MAYVKLFSSLLKSTIWCEQPSTKILWITMLVLAEKTGQVEASVPGLAKLAGVTVPECEEGLKVLMAPDRYSRTKEFEGRRIAEIDGGWQVLNHAKYRAMKSEEEQREANRVKVAKWRAKEREKRAAEKAFSAPKMEVVGSEGDGKSAAPEPVTLDVTNVTTCNQSVTPSTEYKVQSTPSPDGEGGCGGRRAPGKKKEPKAPKVPEWKKPFPEDVLDTVDEIMEFWARPAVDLQPADRQTGKRDPVPDTSRPKLAERLAEIKAEGGDLRVCVAIGRRFVEEYRKPGARVWMKAAQFFFGSRDDAPWRALYRAHVTNEQTLEMEAVGAVNE